MRRIAAALGLLGLLSCAALCAFAPAALAQNPHEGLGEEAVSDVPPGNAKIVGRLEHPDGAARTEGSTIVLYALAADGAPGMRTTKADAQGGFAFEGISNASGITYLIGASYGGVPYGERATFASGQSELSLTIEVEDPIADASRITVSRSSLRFEWIGSSLGVEEIHQLDNPDPGVVYVPPGERDGKTPAFQSQLPQGVGPVDTSVSGVSEGFETRGDALRFWGPIYEGGFELRFRYMIALPADTADSANRGTDIPLRWPLDRGSRSATIAWAPGGPQVRIPNGPEARRLETGDGPLEAIDLGPVAPGAGVDLVVSLPEMTADISGIKMPRADYWLDADDTFLQVNVENYFDVPSGALLVGSPEAPLLTLGLPPGAELMGASSEAQDLGVIPLPNGSLGVLGPLAPGRSGFAYRYRVPVIDGRPRFDVLHPVPVDTLNVLIADTGVVVHTDRLHRRRPFRQGTRLYLHREAYALEAGEPVTVELDLIDRGSIDPRAHLFTSSAFAALGVWFIVSPLTRRSRDGEADYERARIRSERDIVYQAIRDLEHDHETGKIEGDEYATMRGELRARAVALLQAEKQTAASPPHAEAAAEPTSPPAPDAAHGVSRFCVQCGTGLEAGWRFCAKCGAPRPEDGEARA